MKFYKLFDIKEKIAFWSAAISVFSVIMSLFFTVIPFMYQRNLDEVKLAKERVVIEMKYDKKRSGMVTLIDLNTHKKSVQDLYYLKLEVISGMIVSTYPIVSYIDEKKEPLVSISSPKYLTTSKLKEQRDDNIYLGMEEVGSFLPNYYYQSFLLQGADGSNHLIMSYYGEREKKQGFVTKEIGISTTFSSDNVTPQEIKEQYNLLYDYLENNGIRLTI